MTPFYSFALATAWCLGATLRAEDAPATIPYECPEWFRDAKFGTWSHWGPDSVSGIFNNYAHDLYTQGSPEYQWQLEHFGHPSQFGCLFLSL